MTFDWNQARAFLATAETGSFSAAARALGQTQPTLGRQVAGLEEALDVVLFERIGRKLVLTPAGQDLLVHMRTMGEAATQVTLIASGRAQAISGVVRVSVTDIFAAYIMPRITRELRKSAPQLRIEVLAVNHLSDLQRHEADIAVRHVRPTQPDLIARKVREANGRLYAARHYVDRLGGLRDLSDLGQADFVGLGNDAEMLQFLLDWGVPITASNFRSGSESGVAAWEMARQGLGVIAMTDDLARQFPEMVEVVPSLDPVPVPYWLTTHRELHNSRRIRMVYDYLADLLSRPDLPTST